MLSVGFACMASKPAGKTRTPSRAAGLVRRFEGLARERSPLSLVYDTACSQIKAFFSPSNLASSTLSEGALAKLTSLTGLRIFDSTTVRALAPGHPVPHACKVRKSIAGATTAAAAKADPAFRAKLASSSGLGASYVGNWALLVRRVDAPRMSASPTHLAVVGFMDCGGGREGPRPRTLLGPERLVKHMNLCTYARRRHGERYHYLFTGAFAAAVDRPGDPEPRVIVNARSGSWALAKKLMTYYGHIRPDESDAEVDAAVVAFATPFVSDIVQRVLLGGGRPPP